MKHLLFAALCMFISACLPAQHMALIRDGLKRVTVLDSSQTGVLVRATPGTYFYCDTLAGNWYSFRMPGYFDGWIHKDSVQFFHLLSPERQREQINRAITLFSGVCHITTKTTDMYGTLRASVYNKTYYPVLELFYDYYRDTKDTVTLIRLLKTVDCGPDGAYAEIFYHLSGYCYQLDKQLFIRQMKKYSYKKSIVELRRAMIQGILHYYRQAGMAEGLTGAAAEAYAEQEVKWAMEQLH